MARGAVWIQLMRPMWQQGANVLARSEKTERWKNLFFLGLSLAFWLGLFVLCVYVLRQFLSVEIFGVYLVRKLLSMLLLALFGLLCFSSLIAALSSYYLSDDLPLVVSLPVSSRQLHAARFGRTFLTSTWMAALFGTPVLLAYGVVFSAPWVYYAAMVLYFGAFLVVPTSIGVALATVLVCVFPAQRARDLMMFASFGLVVGLLVMLRLLQPERLVDAGSFTDVVSFLSTLQSPTAGMLPAQWGVEILAPLSMGQSGQAAEWLVLTLLTAAAAYVVAQWVVVGLFQRAWTRAQEGTGSHQHTSGLLDRLLWQVGAFLPRPMQALIIKDLKTFFRDSAEWPQLLMVLALMAIYLYSVAVLPLSSSFITERLKNFIAFLNLGMVGFVMSAIAVRFLFTSVSVEGRAFWLLRASPLSPRRFLLAKYLAGAPLLMALGLTLVTASNRLLAADPMIALLGQLTVFGLSLSLAGLSVGMGALYPNFKAENVAQIASGPGGILFMILSQIFVGGVIVLQAVPVWLLLRAARFARPLFPWEWATVLGLLGLSLVLMVGGAMVPMRRGARHLAVGLS